MTEPAEPYPPFAGITVESMTAVMGAPAMTPADRQWLADSVAFVAAYAGRQQVIAGLDDASTLWAAQLHCMRLYQRRGSSSGLMQFDIGVAMYVSRSDPDIRQAYRVDRPMVG